MAAVYCRPPKKRCMRHYNNSIITAELDGDFLYARVQHPDRIAGWIKNSRRKGGIAVIAPYPANHFMELFRVGLNLAPEVGAGIIFFFNPDYGIGAGIITEIIVSVVRRNLIISKALQNFGIAFIPAVISRTARYQGS